MLGKGIKGDDVARLNDLKKINSKKSWLWHITFMGQYMQHNYWQYYMFDDIIGNNPQIKSIIEIGTGYGASTIVLGLYGIKNKISVLTVDINSELSKPVWPIFDVLHVQHYHEDCFSNNTISKIDNIIKNRPTYIICDGGDKPKEFNFWVPRIPINSIISAHDWQAAISMEDIKKVVENHLQQYKPGRWTEMNVQFATFKKIKDRCDI